MKRHPEGYDPPVRNVHCTMYMYIIYTSFVPAASPRALSPSPEHSHKKCVLVFIILMIIHYHVRIIPKCVGGLFSDFDKKSMAMEFDQGDQ